jgi:hypothetical protein
MNPKSAALAFRIWQYAHPLGWDCTVAEIADELREPVQRVQAICQHRGWNRKLRKVAGWQGNGGQNSSIPGFSDVVGAIHTIARYRRLAEEPTE